MIILLSGLSLRQLWHMPWTVWSNYRDWHRAMRTVYQPGLAPTATSVKALPIIPAAPSTPASAPVLRPGGLPPLQQIFQSGQVQVIDPTETQQRAQVIADTLASFGVDAKVVEINTGPAVTQYSIKPGESRDSKGKIRKVRVSRIVNLADDLALALAASPIRIEAPIPGRPYVGIEVPNPAKNAVLLGSLMEAPQFAQHKGVLKLALGQDVSGQAVVADLAAMPHLLIAGATGSGKSVCVNAIVASLLAAHTPATLRFLMVDPKRVELINYNGIPHLLAPVVTELDRVTGVLAWATREMDRRYKEFAKETVRHIGAYNEKMQRAGLDPLPYIVLIIDELADLMMLAPDEIEQLIIRLAQMARATGIHLILATQRPSVNVVTGLIKANFPSRIAFAVSSLTDSRVILDTPGAEKLLGKGDMLFMGPGAAKLQRVQGAFVSDAELNHLVEFWKQAAGPGSEVPLPDLEPEAAAISDTDALLEQAITLVREQGKASISLLQRRLRIGYARAARLIDALEAQGIISADEGRGRGRTVLVAEGETEGVVV